MLCMRHNNNNNIIIINSYSNCNSNDKAVLCRMTQYSIHLKRSAIHAQAVYFLHSTIPSVTCLFIMWTGIISDVSVICRITYFQFLSRFVFLQYICRQAAPATVAYFWFDTLLFLSGTYSPGERL